MVPPISTSVFDIFKIGPGPSSSHTIGPMKAASCFLDKLQDLPAEQQAQLSSLHVHLYGSLSATGIGHGTHKAVLAGLLGWLPESCDSDELLGLMSREGEGYQIQAGDQAIEFSREDIHFDGDRPGAEFANTLVFTARGPGGVVLEAEYYSIGGGFIRSRGEEEPVRPLPVHAFSNMTELRRLVNQRQQALPELILENEEQLSGKSREEIEAGLDRILGAMQAAVDSGLAADGVLPGPIGLQRKARVLDQHSRGLKNSHDRFLAALNAYSLAASEENGAGRKVVTAPTSGSAGVIPGVVAVAREFLHYSPRQLRQGLVAAAAIAFVARHNASIAGAEVGCQGEVGVAAAMAAAFLAQGAGATIHQLENAAEIALEHHLGMTCDPVGGYVQIPCIERNAMGAVSAYNAYLLASVGEEERQKISLDQVIEAMRLTGAEMSTKYKETAQGGLAVCSVHC
ncbi:L-serine ammonia-lyase [Desulfogranum mediterraneum]|uniref:L-serine ammonia-lyase n=1 Tax=Desulfogranum mediterraneum TaxID=160661 RepID=UPI00040E7C93|nr:L-serine ammonia-lyase [Desulfogranum mediterraneum]